MTDQDTMTLYISCCDEWLADPASRRIRTNKKEATQSLVVEDAAGEWIVRPGYEGQTDVVTIDLETRTVIDRDTINLADDAEELAHEYNMEDEEYAKRYRKEAEDDARADEQSGH